MAPVKIKHEPSNLPLALAVLRIAAAVHASFTVGRSLYRSHKSLGPAQDTRHRAAERRKLTVAFGSLAALALALAINSSLDYLALSYKVWASERGIEVPDSVWANRTLSANATAETGLQLRRWLSDTPIYFDALEIVAEKSRRLWWGQQLDLATVSWTALLAIEGRRRRIPHLWAYALLPHLVNLSFAQNLFYVALIQTPSPIPSRETRIAEFLRGLFPKKPLNWFPKLSLLLPALILNYAAILWLPFTTGTSSFPTSVALSKILTLVPLILPVIVPASWGTVYADPHDAHPGITKLFNAVSVAGALLHAKTTVAALLYNLPDSHKHRHSIKIPFDTERRSKWERTATAVEKVLGAVTDHPAVGAAGKDALLSALSLGIWAAVRGTDVYKILRAACLTSKRPESDALSEEAPSGPAKAEPAARDESPSRGPEFSMTLRRRGRPKKTSVSSIGSISNEPVEETTATTTTTANPTPRRRGRPRKIKPEPEEEHDEQGAEEAPDDETYEPTPAVRAAAGLGDVLPADDDLDWEPAALAWALTAVAGLGFGSAAVFGAECVSR